ncbi:MAG: hypothetical protein WC044_04490 [Crocinitomicaceae bacterium]
MSNYSTFFFSLFFATYALADLKYNPVQFSLSTEKESYYEGEKITFLITITNTSEDQSYPVLLPNTQNSGQKLFYLNLYDKANNTFILRATEDREINLPMDQPGTVEIRYLKPLEQIVLPIYMNDFENYTVSNNAHHRFEIPIFAGIYKVNLTYNPNGIALGDSIYHYYSDFDETQNFSPKQEMHENGFTTHFIPLKIKRSKATELSWEGKNYFIRYESDLFWYYADSLGNGSSMNLVHLSNLPVDSCSLPKGEYFYSHFYEIYAEYINRFEDGDVKEYRKYSNYCPEYLYTEKYNDEKQLTFLGQQLPDGRFYSATYNQPQNTKQQESYCLSNGTKCMVTNYTYNEKGELIQKLVSHTEPCMEVELNGKIRSYRKGILEIGH